MKFTFYASVLTALLVAQPGVARTINVQMKNSGTGGMMVFEPSLIKAEVGDTIHFEPTNPGHNAETIGGMLPAGVAPSAGKVSQPFDLKLTKAGLYGVKCAPHFGMGMVALIKAGDGAAPNAAEAKSAKLPPLATKRMSALLAAAK